MKKQKFTIGTDPEFFLQSQETQEFVPASMFFLEHNKDNPKDFGGGFGVLRDNVMVEFNVPPASSKEEFLANIYQGIDLIRREIPENIDFKFQASAEFSKEDLKNYAGGLEFGCSEYFNVYNIAIPNPKRTNMRFAGGHVHVGMPTKMTDEDLERVVKIFDYNLAVPSFEMDKDEERRKYYGTPGCFRITPYGFEYRSLSNFWLASDDLISWVYDQVELSINQFYEGVVISAEQVLQSIELKEQV
jgi:hypothetical protein